MSKNAYHNSLYSKTAQDKLADYKITLDKMAPIKKF